MVEDGKGKSGNEPAPAPDTPTATTTDGSPPPEFRRVAFYAVLGGLTPFVPLPFLDDWVLDRLKRSMVAGILQKKQIDHDGKQVKILVCGPERPKGCLHVLVRIPSIIVKKILLYTIKKIISKVFLIFNIKTCANLVEDCFELGFLILHATDSGALSSDDALTEDALSRVYQAIATASSHEDAVGLPVRDVVAKTFSESKNSLREWGRMLAKVARRLRAKFGRKDEPADEDPDFAETLSPDVTALTNVLAKALWQMPDYLQSRRDLFDQSFGAAAESPGDDV